MDSKKEDWFGQDEYDAIANGCDVIEQEDIDSVKRPKIYLKQWDWLNDELQKGMRETLTHSKNRIKYKYGETGYIVRTDFHLLYIPVDGDYHSVKLINGNLVRSLKQSGLNEGCLICIHNHPSNLIFSYEDIRNFLNQPIVSAIVIVGNTHNVHILRKKYETITDDNFRYNSIFKWMQNCVKILLQNKMDIATAKRQVVSQIVNNANSFNLEYKYNRRGKK